MSCLLKPASRMNVWGVGVDPEVMALRITIEVQTKAVATHLAQGGNHRPLAPADTSHAPPHLSWPSLVISGALALPGTLPLFTLRFHQSWILPHSLRSCDETVHVLVLPESREPDGDLLQERTSSALRFRSARGPDKPCLLLPYHWPSHLCTLLWTHPPNRKYLLGLGKKFNVTEQVLALLLLPGHALHTWLISQDAAKEALPLAFPVPLVPHCSCLPHTH